MSKRVANKKGKGQGARCRRHVGRGYGKNRRTFQQTTSLVDSYIDGQLSEPGFFKRAFNKVKNILRRHQGR
jgi:hypothetical protein